MFENRFENLRLRITAWYVFLTALAFFILVSLGAALFSAGLTRALDEELDQLATEILPIVEIHNGVPDLQQWATKVHSAEPARLLASIQLFDQSKHFIEEYGRTGLHVFAEEREIRSPTNPVRCITKPLYDGRKHVGYLQLQLPTKHRQHAIGQFTTVMTVIAPVLLLVLAALGYLFEHLATRPIERAFSILQTFMADAGHELKTPVSVMHATVENLVRKGHDEEVTKKLDILNRALERMSHLVQDLILLSDLETKQLPAKSESIRLDRLVQDLIEEMQDLFQQKPVSLVSGVLQPATVAGDPDGLQRMVGNLLSNALRYTEAGGTVTVSVQPKARQVWLTVSDTGIGIPPDSLKKIFERFYRVDKSRSRRLGGAGLGLAIVKAIIDAHKGTINVESTVGKGTEFTVLLPLST